VRCPTLNELPSPPPGKQGWPWTEESLRLWEQTAENRSYPRITVVSPSLNQGRFIEETIRSVLLQGYPDLEYLIIDGGSTDSTVEIIEKYSKWITFWVSTPDRGQSAALNRGFGMACGLYGVWINSDDLLCKNALADQALKVGFDGGVLYVGDCVDIDETGKVLSTNRGRVHSLEDLLRIPSVWRSGGYISQPEVLFPIELMHRVGGLNEDNHLTMDYELWGKFFLAGCKVYYTGIPFGCFRHHQGQKTQQNFKQTESMLEVARRLIALADNLPPQTKDNILRDLDSYWDLYPNQVWRATGRLAKIGLPSSVVNPIRKLKRAVEKTITNFKRSAEGLK
jgi:glycosyltransferase involved in cell wall biosynthesis